MLLGLFGTTTATPPAESSRVLPFYSGLGFISHVVSPAGSTITLADCEEVETLFFFFFLNQVQLSPALFYFQIGSDWRNKPRGGAAEVIYGQNPDE